MKAKLSLWAGASLLAVVVAFGGTAWASDSEQEVFVCVGCGGGGGGHHHHHHHHHVFFVPIKEPKK